MTQIYAHGATTPMLAKMPTYILKTASSTNVHKTGPFLPYPYIEEWNSIFSSHPVTKINSKWKDLNARPKLKLWEKKAEQTLRDVGVATTSGKGRGLLRKSGQQLRNTISLLQRCLHSKPAKIPIEWEEPSTAHFTEDIYKELDTSKMKLQGIKKSSQ